MKPIRTKVRRSPLFPTGVEIEGKFAFSSPRADLPGIVSAVAWCSRGEATLPCPTRLTWRAVYLAHTGQSHFRHTVSPKATT
jgi:hypothetical protein